MTGTTRPWMCSAGADCLTRDHNCSTREVYRLTVGSLEGSRTQQMSSRDPEWTLWKPSETMEEPETSIDLGDISKCETWDSIQSSDFDKEGTLTAPSTPGLSSGAESEHLAEE